MIRDYQSEQDLVILFDSLGVFGRNGHYKYTSGFHGPDYFKKEYLISNLTVVSDLARLIAENLYENLPKNKIVVAGPVFGGALLANKVAEELNKLGSSIEYSIPLGKSDKELIIKPPYNKLLKGAEVLFVDDVINRGRSLFQSIELIYHSGGKVTQVASIFSHGFIDSQKLGLPVKALLTRKSIAYHPDECPMCRAGIPLNKEFGHGDE